MDKLYEKGFTQNRELSWLCFNDRVLSEAMDETVPLLERLKFIAIFTSNLEEFFMIRVGSLVDLMSVNEKDIDNKSGMTPHEQLERIFDAVRPLYKKRDQLFSDVENFCGLTTSIILILMSWRKMKRKLSSTTIARPLSRCSPRR